VDRGLIWAGAVGHLRRYAGLVAARHSVLPRLCAPAVLCPRRRQPARPVTKTHADMVAAVFHTIEAQPDPAAVSRAWEEASRPTRHSFLEIGPLMDAAEVTA
jgi:hypothetical protein